MNNKPIITYIITYPGSGTHLLHDSLWVLNVPRSTLADYIYKLVLLKDNAEGLSIDDINVGDKNLFAKMLKATPDVLVKGAEYDRLINVLDEYFSDQKPQHAYMYQPHASFEEYITINKKNIFWSKVNIDLFHFLLKKCVSELGYNYKEVAYCRNPIDLVASKNARFKQHNYSITEELEKLENFCQHITSNQLKIYKYENLCQNPKEFLTQLMGDLKNQTCDVSKAMEMITYSSIGINKRHGLTSQERKKTIAQSQKIVEILGYESSKRISVFGKIIQDIDLVKWEFQHINKFLFEGDFTNDAAISRHRNTFIARVYFFILRKISKRARKNFRKFYFEGQRHIHNRVKM